VGTAREFPAVDAATRVGNFDVVKTLFESVPLVPLLFVLVNRLQPFRERVLVNVKLVVQLRIWVACDALVVESGATRRALSVILQHVVRPTVLFKILKVRLQLLISWLQRLLSTARPRPINTSLFATLCRLFIFWLGKLSIESAIGSETLHLLPNLLVFLSLGDRENR